MTEDKYTYEKGFSYDMGYHIGKQETNAKWVSRIQKRIDEWKTLESPIVDFDYEIVRHIVVQELEGLLKEKKEGDKQ